MKCRPSIGTCENGEFRMENLEFGMKGFLLEWNNSEPYISAHTSGSTGEPKEIRLLKSDMISSARATNEFFKIDGNSVLALPLSFDYIAGKMMAVRSLIAGCRLIEMPVSNNIELSESPTLISIVPSQITSLLSNKIKPENVLVGGAPLTPEQESAIIKSGINAWLGYGMTETCSHVAIRRVGHDGIFHAMPGISFSTDTRGCLVIHSERFSWKSLITNDVVELITPESFRWVGRYDNVVNSGGIKIHPEKLEAEYRKVAPSLPPFFLTGEPHNTLGESLLMVIEGDMDNTEIIDMLSKAIPDRKLLPKRIVRVDALPRTANGKLNRKIT